MVKLLEKDTTDCIIQEVSIKSYYYLLNIYDQSRHLVKTDISFTPLVFLKRIYA